jgi:uncharacterized iron-regulated membrane protein
MAVTPFGVERQAPCPATSDAAPITASTTIRHPLRKCWLRTHLYLGLFGGALFVLLSLTGSTLVFYKTIDEWLHPELLTAQGSGPYRPLNEIVAAAQGAGPSGGVLDSVSVPQHERGTFLAWHKVPTGTAEEFRWYQVTIDPYTGAVLARDREWGGFLMSFIYELHESLLMERTGETIVGFIALFLLASIATGMYLWWPRPGRVRQAVTFAAARSPIRRYHEWHKVSGFYSASVLFVLAFTGVYLEFPKYVITLVALFSPVQETPKENAPGSHPIPGTRALSAEEALHIAQDVFPEGELRFLKVPHGDTGVYRIVMRQPGEVGESGGQSQVWLDQYSGAVLKVRDWRAFTAGETFVAWLFPLHNGEAFGLAGRWIVFMSGFIPLILYVTALRVWWLKHAAHRRQRARLLR